MGEVLQGEFGYKPVPIPGMPKSAPELLNRLAVLAHDRNKAVKEFDVACRFLAESERTVLLRRGVMDALDTKIFQTNQELIDDITRECVGRTV